MKTNKEHLKEKHKEKLIDCTFGIKKFNLNKRKLDVQELATANKPGKGRGKPIPPPPPPGPTGGLIYLDFTGHTVSNTSWNYQGDIVCSPANLTSAQVDEIVANVINEFAPFQVTITTDETVFNAAPLGRKIRVILTESWEWYGQSGGVAFLGSFKWTDNSPCFVFTSLLNYNTKSIKEAVVHETGHTMGLYHQSTYDANCVKTAEYSLGDGVDVPIMGNPQYAPDPNTRWWVGPSALGCTSIQDDAAILKSLLGAKI